jgi:hypothetical protein
MANLHFLPEKTDESGCVPCAIALGDLARQAVGAFLVLAARIMKDS